MGRLTTFLLDGSQRYGAVTDGGLIPLSPEFPQWPTLKDAIAGGGIDELVLASERSSAAPVDEPVTYCLPIPNPEKIICIGVNYPDRNAEYKDGRDAPPFPSVFVRFPRSFVGHMQPIVRPKVSAQLDYEGEVVLVIGKAGRHIPEARALDHVAAITLCNEGCVRDWMRHAKFNVTQGKNFDATGSIGPWIVPFDSEEQIADIGLRTRVNGELRQQDRTGRMTFSFRYLISYVSTFTTLVAGDIIVTGTPTGAGARHDPPLWLEPGDVVEVEADGFGTLENHVISEAS